MSRHKKAPARRVGERFPRRDPWDWPDPERHPAVGIQRARNAATWKASWINDGERGVHKCFADRTYGSTEAALEAAIEWRERLKQRHKNHQEYGRKLDPEQAGNVIEYPNRFVAKLTHASMRFSQGFAKRKYGDATAEAYAHYALDLWRKELLAIAKMPKERQKRIAWGLEEFRL
jgi:hypothetical protein